MSAFVYLIAVDGSEPALRAVDHVIRDSATRKLAVRVELVNVQAALSANVTRFIDSQTIADFHLENGQQLLAPALERLRQAGLAHAGHVLVGEAAPSLVQFAEDVGCTLLVMGARGFGSVIGMVMGSVATKVLHLSRQPVLLVK